MKDVREMMSRTIKLECGECDGANCEYVKPRTKLACCGLPGPELLLHMAPISQKSDSQISITILLE